MTKYIIKKCSIFSVLLYLFSLAISQNFYCYKEPLYHVVFFFGNIIVAFNWGMKYDIERFYNNKK